MSATIGVTAGSGSSAQDERGSLRAHSYIQAILKSGGVPLIIGAQLSEAEWEAIYARVDGILFSGGGDIDVGLYAGKPHAAVHDVDPLRDALELNLLRAAAGHGKPFLGICRGCQVVNVGFGGTLYTDLPTDLPGALEHDQADASRGSVSHEVQIEPGTRLSGIVSQSMSRVNSYHHQGIWEVGADLRVGARAPDGLVEAVELPDHPFGVAVQWHPERLLDQPHAPRLFGRFVDAAAAYRERSDQGWSI
jgi:putative glutamine amidotransferase